MPAVDIVFVGVTPPPRHGMALVNDRVCDALEREGLRVRLLNTAPMYFGSGVRSLVARMSRVPKHIGAWIRLICTSRKSAVLYLSIASGHGLLYDIITLAIWRVGGGRSLIHHHSWARLETRSATLWLACRIAGDQALHVALCGEMAKRLEGLYNVRATVLSNCGFVDAPSSRTEYRRALAKIGFLSNLTREKGTWTVLELAQSLCARERMGMQIVVAGPCSDTPLSSELRRLAKTGKIEWRGAVYGKEKRKFWTDVDAFIFPSVTEAEPLVVWEALAHGIPVIALQRGCIPCQVPEGAGHLVVSRERFCKEAENILTKWRADSASFWAARDAASRAYRTRCATSADELATLVKWLNGGTSPSRRKRQTRIPSQ